MYIRLQTISRPTEIPWLEAHASGLMDKLKHMWMHMCLHHPFQPNSNKPQDAWQDHTRSEMMWDTQLAFQQTESYMSAEHAPVCGGVAYGCVLQALPRGLHDSDSGTFSKHGHMYE